MPAKNTIVANKISGRAWFGDVLTEFWAPQKASGKIVILCDGCPTVPSKKRAAEALTRKGYWVFHMRYRGSWESRGKFLQHEPSEDVRLVASGIRRGFIDVYTGVQYIVDVSEMVVIGASFGGAAAVIASTFPEIDKAIALAPLIDWTVESKSGSIDQFAHMLVTAFGEGYRPVRSAYEKIKSGKFFQPLSRAKEISPKKLLIIHARDDKVIPLAPLRKFAKDARIKPVILGAGGHFSASTILEKEVWKHAHLFLKMK